MFESIVETMFLIRKRMLRFLSDFCSCEAIIAPKTELVNTFLKKIGKIFRILEKKFQKPLYKTNFLWYNDSIIRNLTHQSSKNGMIGFGGGKVR